MPDRQFTGRAWRYGSDIDTDTIVPSQYMRLEPEEYAPHAMEPIDPEFGEAVEPGDIVVAETNFGIGSSREHAVIALKELGVGAVIAESFARIFYRNAVNEGLPVISTDLDVVQAVEDGDELHVDLDAGTIENRTKDRTDEFEPFTEPVKSILEAGGVVDYLADK